MSCRYPLCTSRRRRRESKHLKVFTFPPRDKERALQWAVNCGRPDLVAFLSKGGILASWNGICTLHFERPCFMNDLKLSLTRFAVPTIFQSKAETDAARILHTNTIEAMLATIRANSNSKIIPGKAEWLNGNANELRDSHGTLLQTIPTTDSSLNCTTLTKSDHAADIDPSESNQELYYPDGRSTFSTVSLPANKKCSVIQRPALMDVSENTSKELLCRLCAKLVCKSQMVHIFGQSSSSKEYLRKMNTLLPSSEQPAENDVLTKWICNVCRERLNYCDQIVNDFVLASVKLKSLFPHTKQDQAVINNFKWAAGQAGDVIKQEDLLDFLLGDAHQEQDVPKPTYANNLEIDDASKVGHRPDYRQERNLTKSNPAISVFLDHNYDSLDYMGLQSEHLVSDKNSVFQHSSNAKHRIKVLRKQLTNDSRVHLESQDHSFSDSVLVRDIISPMKRKADQLDNEIKSASVSFSPKLIEVESVDQLHNLKFSKGLLSNKPPLFSSTSSSRVKRVRRTEQEECQGKRIQSSHTLIPTASDNKTFLCKNCDMSFLSIESALTHRFKEHPEEILCSKRKLK